MDTASVAVIATSSVLPATHRAFVWPGRLGFRGVRRRLVVAASPDKAAAGGGGGSNGRKLDMSNSKYVVPLDKTMPGLTRPLAEILRDLNKRVSDKIINSVNNSIPWYHANRMLSFYAPGWCGEVRDVIFSDNGNVTVVYRVTIRGSDGEQGTFLKLKVETLVN
ncbi:hypothetical protein HPP92_006941 [Vanilla planifolia]|uniref:Uncharacterized protein n=1 Tax=Vanilla planifolia TaxID=51239 RepID=A0A835RGK9_VANPL|nr:hypothetical protein HPP92_006941 [Vanilla planifolia]